MAENLLVLGVLFVAVVLFISETIISSFLYSLGRRPNNAWSRLGCIGAPIVIWSGQRQRFLAKWATLQPPSGSR